MSWPVDAYVGQKVVCIRGPDRVTFSWETNPKKGEIYTIRQLDCVYDKVVLWLVEIVNPPAMYQEGHGECGFWASRFRPVQTFRNDIGVFQRIADKVNEKIKEDV